MNYLIKNLYLSSARYVFYLSQVILLWTLTLIGYIFSFLSTKPSNSNLKPLELNNKWKSVEKFKLSDDDDEETIEEKIEEKEEEDVFLLNKNSFNGGGLSMQSENYQNEHNIFSPERCKSWFQSYIISSSRSDEMNEEDVIRFCSQIDKSLEDIVHLVLAYKMNAAKAGCFTLEEWLKGMSDLEIDSELKLLTKWEWLRSLLDDKAFLRKVYRFSFKFSQTQEQRRNLEMDLCQGLIKLFFENRWALVDNFVEFLNTTKHYGMTQDEFCSVFEFQDLIDDDLNNYDFEGAWPILLDDFVTYMKQEKFK